MERAEFTWNIGGNIMAIQSTDNKFGVAKWIVDPTLGQGTHTTITTAIASASSGDDIFIRPGTYTENFTITPGINLVGFDGDGNTPNVTIVGKITMSGVGTSTISNIRLQTNSDFAVVVSGSVASILNLNNCYLNCSNNTGISYTSSSASSQVNLFYCNGNLGTTGISLYTHSSAGFLQLKFSNFTNSGLSTTASSNSSGNVVIHHSITAFTLGTTSTGNITFQSSSIDCAAINTTALTTAGTGNGNSDTTYFQSGSASGISVGAGTILGASNITVDSTATNAVTGAGQINYTSIDLYNTGQKMNTSTQVGRNLLVGALSFDGGTTTLNSLPVPVASGGTGRATLTNHGVLIGAATGAITQLGAGSSGQVLQSGGASADPAYSTATYPSTTTINQLLYSSSANTIAGLTTANGGVVDTTSGGVPQVDTTNFSVLSTGVQVKGNNTNTAPPAGFIGEQIRSFVAIASEVTLTSPNASNITSINLTAGIWDVSAIGFLQSSGASTTFSIAITTVSGTLPGNTNIGDNQATWNQTNGTATAPTLSIPSYRMTLSGTTTVYLVGQATFSTGSGFANGRVSGTRVG